MISVLIPSRGRPGSLVKTVETLRSKATKPSHVEILVAVDLDDEATIKTVSALASCTLYRCYSYGYERLHRYFNILAEAARGDWLMIYGDDCLIETIGWDEKIEALDPAELIWANGTQSSSKNPCFPVISRAWYEAMGQISLHWANDAWLKYAARHWPGVKSVTLPIHTKHKQVFDYTRIPGYPHPELEEEVKTWVQSMSL